LTTREVNTPLTDLRFITILQYLQVANQGTGFQGLLITLLDVRKVEENVVLNNS
jgi:hypothetical protein